MSNKIGSQITEHMGDVIHPQPNSGEITTRYITRTNAYAFFDAATHHERLLTSEGTWACQTTGMWVMGAVETTQESSLDITLDDLFCGNVVNQRYHITGMPIFTATPMAETPIFLTTSYVVQEAGTTPSTVLDGWTLDDIVQGRVTTRPPVGTVKVLNVRIRVFAWQANGQPASNTQFSWTCLAEGVITSKA